MRYLMKFSYDGSYFNGLEKQKGYETIQGTLESLLEEVNNGKKVNFQASGRTDKGVHAVNQYAHFDMDVNFKTYGLIKFLNKRCNGKIYIKEIKEVEDNFHARYYIKNKTYKYYINVGNFNPFMRNYIYQYCKELDIEKMQKALKEFIGKHDFKSFCMNEKNKENTIRTIYSADITKNESIICITITGDGFLRKMVRNIVGILIEIGSNKKSIEDLNKILKSNGALHNKKCAPPNGLYLEEVEY